MRQSAELHIGLMILIESHQVFAWFFGLLPFCVLCAHASPLGWRPRHLDGAGQPVTTIEIVMLDTFALEQQQEALHALRGDLPAGLEKTYICRQRIALSILHVVNQSHWTEGPQDEQGPRISLRAPIETCAPVERRRCIG